MQTPLVSILTTVFNREDFLSDCISSVLYSSFEDWEMVIVDDVSSDNSFRIACEWAAKDARIKAYRNEVNLGDYANRNRASSYAKGKYLKYLDADDTLYRYSLAYFVEALEQHPDAVLALSHNVIDPMQPYPYKVSSAEALSSFLYGKNVLGVGPSAAIIRRSAFESVGGFTGTRYVGDVELWVKLALSGSVVALAPSLVYWRQHEGQQIVSERKDASIIKVRYLHKLHTMEAARTLLNNEEYPKAKSFIRYRYARTIWNFLLLQRNPSLALFLFKESGLSLGFMIRSFFVSGKSPTKRVFI